MQKRHFACALFIAGVSLILSAPAYADSRPIHGGRAADIAESQIYLTSASGDASHGAPQTSSALGTGIGDLDDDDDYLTAPQIRVADPFEPWNRFWYHVNDVIYMQFLKPIHEVYVLLTPQEFRSGINNFFHNLSYPVRLVNALLQGDFYDAGVETSRFIVNTTVGIGGFFDVTRNNRVLVPVNNVPKDFGSTLAYWGVDEGPFFILPLFGPSTIRDTVGFGGDMAATPTTYIPLNKGGAPLLAARVLRTADTSLGPYETLRKISIEPYIALRNAYLQNRRQTLEKAGIISPNN